MGSIVGWIFKPILSFLGMVFKVALVALLIAAVVFIIIKIIKYKAKKKIIEKTASKAATDTIKNKLRDSDFF